MKQICFWIIALALLGFSGASARAAGCFDDQIRGITLASWGWDAYGAASADAAQKFIKDEDANTVVLLRPYQVNFETNRLQPVAQETPTNEHLAHAITEARSLGLEPVLKLHLIDVKDGNVLANAQWAPKDPKEFFASYKEVALDNARFAAAQGVKILVLGTELGGILTADPKFTPYFLDLIKAVRQVYNGKLAFATQVNTHVDKYARNGDTSGFTCVDKIKSTNWCLSSDEAQYFSFWNALDYIGIDAYANIGAPSPATEKQMEAGYYKDADGYNFIDKLAGIVQKNGDKPLLITEIGAPSVADAHKCLGCWGDGKTPDNQEQANIYDATLNVLCANKDKLHLAGVFLYALDAYTNDRTKKLGVTEDPTSFSFMTKAAADVIRTDFEPE